MPWPKDLKSNFSWMYLIFLVIKRKYYYVSFYFYSKTRHVSFANFIYLFANLFLPDVISQNICVFWRKKKTNSLNKKVNHPVAIVLDRSMCVNLDKNDHDLLCILVKIIISNLTSLIKGYHQDFGPIIIGIYGV